jgi:hypothetical protein
MPGGQHNSFWRGRHGFRILSAVTIGSLLAAWFPSLAAASDYAENIAITILRDQAVSLGLIDRRTWEKGVADLYRATEPDGTFCYTFFKGVAVRP